MPKISVVTVTIRPGMFRLTREALEQQTLKDFEWVVIDARYEERKEAVAEYMKDCPFEFHHYPDPPKDKRYNLAKADNEGIKKSSGELLVWLQDFILIEPDGLQKYWDLYQAHPDGMYTGVDGRFSIVTTGKLDPTHPTDILQGADWTHGNHDYVNSRAYNTETIESKTPYDFELNWAAFARTVAEDIGGFNEEYDHGFAYDNTEFAFRAMQMGKKLWVDPRNIADAMNHWELFSSEHGLKEQDPFIPEREAAVEHNAYRYNRYIEAVKNGLAPIYMNYL